MAHLDIANRLAIYGYKKELEDFDELLAGVWWKMLFEEQYGTVEMMLHNPKGAITFCKQARIRAGVPDLIDSEILLRLTNIRKSGFLKASKP